MGQDSIAIGQEGLILFVVHNFEKDRNALTAEGLSEMNSISVYWIDSRAPSHI
jgi:hypothetical protein